MSGKRKYDYPKRKELIKLLREHGQYAVAEMIGCSRPTLQHHLRKEGISKKDYENIEAWSSSKVPAMSEKVSPEEMLQQEVKELRRQLQRDRKEHVYEERITLAVEQAIDRIQPTYSPSPVPKAKSKKGTTHEFVLSWSDLHAGEVVSEEETGGLNKYNWEIMMERHDKLRRALFSYQDNRPYPVKKLYIFALGDMLSGNIHTELEATNQVPMAECIVRLAVDGSKWLVSLLERFDEIEVHGVVGNHPRAHKKPWFKQGYDNADWTAYHIMAEILRENDRITFDIPKSSQHRVIVAGKWANLIFHGDGIPSGHAGIPWAGVMKRVQALRNQYADAGQRLDYFHCGHFHVANAVEQGTVIMNGSVKGIDEYALKRFGGGQPPVQVLSTFHPKKGLTDVSFLDCV